MQDPQFCSSDCSIFAKNIVKRTMTTVMGEGARIDAPVKVSGYTTMASNDPNDVGAWMEIDGNSLVGAKREQFKLQGCLC